MYVSSAEGKSVRVFRFRKAISPSIFEIKANGSPFKYKAQPSSVVNDPTGRFTMITQKESNLVSMFFVHVSTGELLTIPENEKPYKLDGQQPIDALFHPGGKFAYVLNEGSKSISQIKVSRKFGEMSKIASAVKTNGVPESMAIDPAGKFLYVINSGKKSLQRFSIDSESGKLTSIKDVSLNYVPEFIVISRDFK